MDDDGGVRGSSRPFRPDIDLAPIVVPADVPAAVDLAWLAGFLDAEGSFQITVRRVVRDGEQRRFLLPQIQVSNTHQPTLPVVRAILDRAGVHYFVGHYVPRHGRQRKWHIHLAGYRQCSALLHVLMPYMQTKKAAAQMLAEYCATRRANKGGFTPRQREIVAWFGHTAPEGHGNALLSDEEVRAARHAYDQGQATIRELAQRYRLSLTAMYHIVHRHSYRHVLDDDVSEA